MAVRATILVLMVTLVVVASAGLLGELRGKIAIKKRCAGAKVRALVAGDRGARRRLQRADARVRRDRAIVVLYRSRDKCDCKKRDYPDRLLSIRLKNEMSIGV